MIRKITLALGACLAALSNAQAIERMALDVGYGEDHTKLVRVSLDEPWRKRQPPAGTVWRLAGYWQFSGALWDNATDSTADIGVMPVFRFERYSIFVEGGLGFHLVQTHISAHRTFSTAFQFSERVAVGTHFRHFDFGVGLQHLSNGGLREPNPGINFLLMHLRYVLE